MAGLYIHIPFCRSKCIYCDFYSKPQISRFESVIVGLIREFDARRSEIVEPFTTIYIGGGTPSIIPTTLLGKLVDALPFENVEEFTIEVNPDDVSVENVKAWKAMGINRVSMGIQTFDDRVLRQIGRRHDSRQALRAIEILNSGGIDNISADLIYGLPGVDQKGWERDLKILLNQSITHLSAYCLSFNEGTMLYKMLQQGRVAEMSDDETVGRYEALCAMTMEAGFEHYEISNFALPGYRSKHNSAYWNPKHTWLGIGPSAHSFDGSVRRVDIPDIAQWLQKLPNPVVIDAEVPLDIINDLIVTSLRTAEGLDLDCIPARFHERLLNDAKRHLASGVMIHSDGHLRILPEHWLMSNCYIRDLIII